MNEGPDVEALQRCLRDVFGLLTLPALWSGGDRATILRTLLEAIEALLRVDFAYAAARAQPGEGAIERLRWCGADRDASSSPWRETLRAFGVAEATAATGSLHADGVGTLSFLRLPIGYYADHGVLLVGARREGFPTADENAILRAAVTLASTGLHSARVMHEREVAVRLKDEFLAMLGHELRNPVAAIGAATAVLGRRDVDPATGRQAYDVLQRQTGQLTRLLDDLLDVSRATSGHITLDCRPVDLAAIVARAVAVVEASGPAQHTVTVTATPVTVSADGARIEQIVMNLLTNAIKYTPAGGRIDVIVDAADGFGVLTVRDSGIGIPADLLPRVFDIFVRGGLSTGHRAAGLGIGLALVRKLVELHQGTIDAHSDGPGRGSTFVVRLPRAVDVDEGEPPPAARAAGARRRVLLIEDHDDNREMLGHMLRIAGHDVDEAADGGGGVARARERRPDVALVDIGLPDIDGYEVARRIREALGPDVHLVALTGFGQPEDRARALAAGFDAHLVKPVMPDRLAALLEQVPSRSA